jgi:opacity protein-like surface antigen
MKKTFLLIATLLMLGSTAFAGGDFDFAIGPKVGYQTAQLSYKRNDIKTGFANHWTAGIFARFTLGRFYLQPELMYFNTSKVFDVNVTNTGSSNLFNLPTGANVNMTLTQMNLQLPVLVGFNIFDSKIITLRAQVGPTANFVLNSKTLYNETYSLNGQEATMSRQQLDAMKNQKFDTKSISWGLQAGVGIDLLKRITLDIDYNFGLSKIFNNLSNTTMGEYFDFNNVNIDNPRQGQFIVTIGVKFF